MPTDLWAHQTSRIALSRAKATGGSPLNSKPCIPLSIHHRCVDAKRHLNLKTSKLVSIFYSKLAPPTGLHHLCGCSFLNLGAILDCSFSPASYPTQMQVLTIVWYLPSDLEKEGLKFLPSLISRLPCLFAHRVSFHSTHSIAHSTARTLTSSYFANSTGMFSP